MKNSKVQFSSKYFPGGSNPVSLNLGPRVPSHASLAPKIARATSVPIETRLFISAAHIILGSTCISCFYERVAIKLPLEITCPPIMTTLCPQKTDIIRRTRQLIAILHTFIRNSDIARGLTPAYFGSPRIIVASDPGVNCFYS